MALGLFKVQGRQLPITLLVPWGYSSRLARYCKLFYFPYWLEAKSVSVLRRGLVFDPAQNSEKVVRFRICMPYRFWSTRNSLWHLSSRDSISKKNFWTTQTVRTFTLGPFRTNENVSKAEIEQFINYLIMKCSKLRFRSTFISSNWTKSGIRSREYWIRREILDQNSTSAYHQSDQRTSQRSVTCLKATVVEFWRAALI